MLLIKGSSDRKSSHHLMHALHKQVSRSAAEFQRWGQRVVYHSAAAGMQIAANPHASAMMIADEASGRMHLRET
jgi:hypothetical protein